MTPASPAPAAQARIAEIAARLKAATPGPWVRSTRNSGTTVITHQNTAQQRTIAECKFPTTAVLSNADKTFDHEAEANAALIAHAPADIAHLLSEVARLEAENAHVEKVIAARDEQLTAEIAVSSKLAAPSSAGGQNG